MTKKKKHGYDELLRYMHLLEKGYSACSIHQQYGINSELLKRCLLPLRIYKKLPRFR